MPDGKPTEHDILALMAHPGDAEILCGGTLALLQERGYGVHIAVVTAGDSGTGGDTASEAARTRLAESRSSAGRIRAGFACLGRQDFHVTNDLTSLDEMVELIRSIEPLLVITNAPEDPLPDREITSLVARQACLAAGAPHYDTAHRPEHHPTRHAVSLYYAAPVGGADRYGQPVPPSLFIDISSIVGLKCDMLTCQKSLAESSAGGDGAGWVEQLRQESQVLGRSAGVEFAEGFRRHVLGPGSAQDPLKELLGGIERE